MIKALIFDIGGVIVRSGDRQRRRMWEQRLGLEDWESEEMIFNSEIGTQAQLGHVSDNSLWDWVEDQLRLSPEEFEQFKVDFWADNKVDQELMAFIRTLRPEYITAVITNATDTMREDMRSRYQIIDAFDLVVCSAEEKVMKPDSDIFHRTLNKLHLDPGEVLFIDDMEKNVEAARALGLNAIQFTPAADLYAEFRRYGVNIGGQE